MRKIALHAHNYGHKNIGDEAMAQNVYNKLIKHEYDVYTISTYEFPLGQIKEKNSISVSGLVNNYNNFMLKVFLVAVNRLKFKRVYAIYSKIITTAILSIAKLYKKGIKVNFLFPDLYKLLDLFDKADIYIRSGSGSLNDIWFWSSLVPQLTEAKLAKLFNVSPMCQPATRHYRSGIT